jgi:hypothetical protein
VAGRHSLAHDVHAEVHSSADTILARIARGVRVPIVARSCVLEKRKTADTVRAAAGQLAWVWRGSTGHAKAEVDTHAHTSAAHVPVCRLDAVVAGCAIGPGRHAAGAREGAADAREVAVAQRTAYYAVAEAAPSAHARQAPVVDSVGNAIIAFDTLCARAPGDTLSEDAKGRLAAGRLWGARDASAEELLACDPLKVADGGILVIEGHVHAQRVSRPDAACVDDALVLDILDETRCIDAHLKLVPGHKVCRICGVDTRLVDKHVPAVCREDAKLDILEAARRVAIAKTHNEGLCV